MSDEAVLEKWETEIIFNMAAVQMAAALKMPTGIPAVVFMAEAIANYLEIRALMAPKGVQSIAEAQALLQRGGGIRGDAARLEQIGQAHRHFTAAIDANGRLIVRSRQA